MPRKPDPNTPVQFPATVIIDTREQSPFSFADLRSDRCDGGGPLVVPTARATLASGDYSIAGLEEVVAVERKSLADLYSTIGQSRERFERELARLNEFRFAAVVIEAEWSAILYHPPTFTRMRPKTIFRSIRTWQQRYTRVHWNLMPDRRLAEIMTLRILQQAWKDAEKLASSPAAESGDYTATATSQIASASLELLRTYSRLRIEPSGPSSRLLAQQVIDQAVLIARAHLRQVNAQPGNGSCEDPDADDFNDLNLAESLPETSTQHAIRIAEDSSCLTRSQSGQHPRSSRSPPPMPRG